MLPPARRRVPLASPVLCEPKACTSTSKIQPLAAKWLNAGRFFRDRSQQIILCLQVLDRAPAGGIGQS